MYLFINQLIYLSIIIITKLLPIFFSRCNRCQHTTQLSVEELKLYATYQQHTNNAFIIILKQQGPR
jgi:hypothetical protein